MRDSQHSVTAAKIARGLLWLARQPVSEEVLPKGLPEVTEAVLRGAGLLKDWHLAVYGTGVFRWMASAAELAAPGLMLHLATRKRAMDDECRAALAQGAKQVLVVGAGFDVLAVRIAGERPDVTCVEIDHPATSAKKRQGVEAAGLGRANLHLVAADLAKVSLAEALPAAWDRSAPSFVLAEGLVMYLPEAAVGALFDAAAACTGPGSVLAVSFMPGDAEGRAQAGVGWVARSSLGAVGEKLDWGPPNGDVAPFLGAHGWRLRELVDFRARYYAPIGRPDIVPTGIERVAVADRA